ncbi:TPA: hypothetical protein QDB06_005848 [Burkholderia vietnamiensis]|nr:DUF6882 domain-containing protein [Burkholderia vietnamiensis]MCA8449259.1 hypothetical protein [Burkholderia vietnamiensis]HDR8953552.1 hypothetical protein [Burkholderia vietnamiensis]HDR9148182.1 hypothetical protein [Burkholderia vietnamiensis]HDR9185208.1 hypothetical protein [Burkholderia vietnamiensis]
MVDYSSRLLTFFVGEAPTAEAFILLLGTYSIDKQRFRWSWSDEGLPMDVRDASRKAKALYDLTGFEIFNQGTFQCDQTMAWEIAALSCSTLAADGACRIPNGIEPALRFDPLSPPFPSSCSAVPFSAVRKETIVGHARAFINPPVSLRSFAQD